MRIKIVGAVALLILPVGMQSGARADGGWRDAGALPAAGALQTATPLADGTVLVTGGRGCPAGRLSTAYHDALIFDGETWRVARPMLTPRDRHAAVLLGDGRVLVAGGQTTAGACTARVHIPNPSAEIYDPVSDAWTLAGRMAVARTGHSLTRTLDGDVIVTGGTDAIERFDATSGTWSRAGTLVFERAGHTATLLRDGRVLVVGGDFGGTPFAGAEIFDPDLGISALTESMAVARSGHTATLMPDGTVLVAGGFSASEEGVGTTSSVEMYDPLTGRWTLLAAMGGSRGGHAVGALPDGALLVAAGAELVAGRYAPLDTAERYDPLADRWSDAPSLSVPHENFAWASLSGGRLLVAGGGYEPVLTDVAEVFVPLSQAT